MNVVVDTSVWSLALRRQRPSQPAEVLELAELVREGRAALLGANTDFLICAVAARREFAILTTDIDFTHYSRLLPISLHTPRSLERD